MTRCQVAIIGAGPAGLTLAHMLARQGIDAVVIEARSEEYVRARVRAGVIENSTVDVLTDLGVADRLHREALVHNGFYLRFDRTTHHLDFHRFDGRHAYVYGQAQIVADLIDARKAAGLPLVFEASDVTIDGIDTATPEVSYTVDGRREHIVADVVAGCDGFHGISRTLLPADVRTLERVYPFAWLGILAHTTPVTEEGMYCAHPDGLSVHSMRGEHITRQYLQVPADTDLATGPTTGSGPSSSTAAPPTTTRNWRPARSSTGAWPRCAAWSPNGCRPGHCSCSATPPTSSRPPAQRV